MDIVNQSQTNPPREEDGPAQEIIYSWRGFLGQSILLTVLSAGLILSLSSAVGWKGWVVAAIAAIMVLGLSIIQATLIENAVILLMYAFILWLLSTTPWFDFHWSVLVAGVFGALNGMIGREGREQEEFRQAYGEEEYRKRYPEGRGREAG